MGWVDEKAEFVDFTLLKKRGLLKVPEEQNMPENCKVRGDFIDFSGAGASSNIAPDTAAGSIAESSNPSSSAMPDFGFLANMASVGAENSATSSVSEGANNATGETASNSEVIVARGSDIESLKVKIDDLEYKLERLIERLERVEG